MESKYATLVQIAAIISVSEGNMKVPFANHSTRPIADCGPNARYCAKDCYACKSYGRPGKPSPRPSVRKAWDKNSAAWRTNRSEAVSALRAWIAKRNPKYFRWHVAGDWLDQDHVDQAFSIAAQFPETRFLAFTKRDDLDFSGRPDNFTVVASLWPTMPDHFPTSLPRAWMQDGTETRVTDNAIECPGSCESCAMCWQLPKLGRDVVFHKH